MVMNQNTAMMVMVGTGVFMLFTIWTLFQVAKRTRWFPFLTNQPGAKLPTIVAGLSIANSWAFAPALYIAALKAYKEGWVGWGWFSLDNVACLIFFSVFGYFAIKVDSNIQLLTYLRDRYSTRVYSLYRAIYGTFLTFAFAAQLLTASMLLEYVAGVPRLSSTVIMSVIPFVYTYFGGLRASVLSDLIQMAIFVIGGIILVPLAIDGAGGWGVLTNGLHGISGTFTSPFSGDGLWMSTLPFGLPTLLYLMSGPVGDPGLHQRLRAVKNVTGSFLLAVPLFLIVPVIFGTFGFLAAGAHLRMGNPELVNVQSAMHFLPTVAKIGYVLMVYTALTSKLSGIYASILSLNDGYRGEVSATRVRMADLAHMTLATVFAISIANGVGESILMLFLMYGGVRSVTFLPITMSIFAPRKRYDEAGIYWGIIAGLCIGFPLVLFGIHLPSTMLMIAGSFAAVLIPGIVMRAVTLSTTPEVSAQRRIERYMRTMLREGTLSSATFRLFLAFALMMGIQAGNLLHYFNVEIPIQGILLVIGALILSILIILGRALVRGYIASRH